MIGVWPHPSTRKKLEAIKERTDYSLSDLCYRLILRGLDEFEKDGILSSPRDLPFIDNDKGDKK